MKAKQISEHIWSLKTWMIVPIHVWVVMEEDGVTLVDAGMPMMAKGIMKFINQLNAGPLRRILLTHGHADHVGAIKSILTINKVPVYAHALEIPYMEGEVLYPKRKKLEKNIPPQLAQPLLERTHGTLQTIAGLTPYLTPGHSPGHVVYYHEQDQVLLAGDLFNAKQGKLHPPMFTPFMGEALQSSLIVKKLNPERLEVCHGSTVFRPAAQLDEYIQQTTRKIER